MSVFRIKKSNHYSVIPNPPFQNREMSLEARGLLAYLLTKPDNWELMNSDLYTCSPAGRHKVDRILAELKSFGHVRRFRDQLPNGQFVWVSEIHEIPILTTIPPFSDDGLSNDGLSNDGKRGYIINTEETNTEEEKIISVSAETALEEPVTVLGENPEEIEKEAAIRTEGSAELRPIDSPFGIFQRLAEIDPSISANQGRALRDAKALLSGDKGRVIPAYAPEDILGCAAFIQQDPYRVQNMIPLTTGVLIQKLEKWIKAGRPSSWTAWKRATAVPGTHDLSELHRDKTDEATAEPLMG